MRKPANLVLGAWEWVALPEFGIACVKARLDAAEARSTLRASDVTSTQVDGKPRLQCRVYPLPGDSRTFVFVESRIRACGARPVMLTMLTIGDESFQVALEVAEAPPGGLSLTLGRDVLDGRFTVDPKLRAVSGPPRLDWHLRRRLHRHPPDRTMAPGGHSSSSSASGDPIQPLRRK